MTNLQTHLTENYTRYLKTFTKKFKNSDLAKQAIHELFIKFEKNTMIPDNIEKFVFQSICNSYYDTVKKRPIQLNTKYFPTGKALHRTIDKYYEYNEETEHSLSIRQEYSRVAREMPKLSKKTQLIINKHIFEDMSLADVARELKSDINGTKHLYLLGRNKLKDLLTAKN